MNWFQGSIVEAIVATKNKNAIFVVFFYGKDEATEKLTSFIDSPRIREKLESDKFVPIKIDAYSPQYQQFTVIYRTVPVPSIYFLTDSGLPLQVVTRTVSSVEDLEFRIDQVLHTFELRFRYSVSDILGTDSTTSTSISQCTTSSDLSIPITPEQAQIIFSGPSCYNNQQQFQQLQQSQQQQQHPTNPYHVHFVNERNVPFTNMASTSPFVTGSVCKGRQNTVPFVTEPVDEPNNQHHTSSRRQQPAFIPVQHDLFAPDYNPSTRFAQIPNEDSDLSLDQPINGFNRQEQEQVPYIVEEASDGTDENYDMYKNANAPFYIPHVEQREQQQPVIFNVENFGIPDQSQYIPNQTYAENLLFPNQNLPHGCNNPQVSQTRNETTTRTEVQPPSNVNYGQPWPQQPEWQTLNQKHVAERERMLHKIAMERLKQRQCVNNNIEQISTDHLNQRQSISHTIDQLATNHFKQCECPPHNIDQIATSQSKQRESIIDNVDQIAPDNTEQTSTDLLKQRQSESYIDNIEIVTVVDDDDEQSINQWETEITETRLDGSSYDEINTARLQFRLANGTTFTKTFNYNDTLAIARQYVKEFVIPEEHEFKLATNFPKREFDETDCVSTLKELELVPTATILVIVPEKTFKCVARQSKNILYFLPSLMTTLLAAVSGFVTRVIRFNIGFFISQGQGGSTKPINRNI